MSPRIAGISTYRGAEVGTGTWHAIVDEPTFRAVVRLLDDPGRKPSQESGACWALRRDAVRQLRGWLP